MVELDEDGRVPDQDLFEQDIYVPFDNELENEDQIFFVDEECKKKRLLWINTLKLKFETKDMELEFFDVGAESRHAIEVQWKAEVHKAGLHTYWRVIIPKTGKFPSGNTKRRCEYKDDAYFIGAVRQPAFSSTATRVGDAHAKQRWEKEGNGEDQSTTENREAEHDEVKGEVGSQEDIIVLRR
jgi:hypothetical protein